MIRRDYARPGAAGDSDARGRRRRYGNLDAGAGARILAREALLRPISPASGAGPGHGGRGRADSDGPGPGASVPAGLLQNWRGRMGLSPEEQLVVLGAGGSGKV
jgi:hypothetical protein